jgi:transposase InsO family protein
MPRSTVARVLKRSGLERLKYLEEQPEIRRYEKRRAGEMIHLDIKKLGRIARIGHRIHGDRTTRVRGIGWEYVHVAIDDASRIAYVEVLEDERGETTAQFLKRACAHFQRIYGMPKIERVLTDNGSGYVSETFARTCQTLSLKHSRTRPYRPQTNGKAERFIQTLLREWAYVRAYPHSRDRTRALSPFVRYYNQHRPHAALDNRPPLTRMNQLRPTPNRRSDLNNVPGNYS